MTHPPNSREPAPYSEEEIASHRHLVDGTLANEGVLDDFNEDRGRWLATLDACRAALRDAVEARQEMEAERDESRRMLDDTVALEVTVRGERDRMREALRDICAEEHLLRPSKELFDRARALSSKSGSPGGSEAPTADAADWAELRLAVEVGVGIEHRLRREWWMNHGHDGLYGDDAEMQCARCPADFLRDPLESLEKKVHAARLARTGGSEAEGAGARSADHSANDCLTAASTLPGPVPFASSEAGAARPDSVTNEIRMQPRPAAAESPRTP